MFTQGLHGSIFSLKKLTSLQHVRVEVEIKSEKKVKFLNVKIRHLKSNNVNEYTLSLKGIVKSIKLFGISPQFIL